MQRPVVVQGSLPSDGDCFEMWHDYLNLGSLLKSKCDNRGGGRGDTEGPKKEAAAPWSHVRISRQEDCENSTGTSLVSSISDISSSLSDTSCSLPDTSSSKTPSNSCGFCKQNKESARVYRSHKLKSDNGKITCPVLRSYICPICRATGDHAHTLRYCPQGQRQEAARMLPLPSVWSRW